MKKIEWSAVYLRELSRNARAQAQYSIPIAAGALKAIAKRYDKQADELEQGRLSMNTRHKVMDGRRQSSVHEFPHTDVYTRLGVSVRHGIGVFAIKPIPKGTDVFRNDLVDLVWVEKAELDRAPLLPEERQLYHDFGISRGSLIGCPANFHNLTPGWYCNEPAEGEDPNIGVDADLNFLALSDIAPGDELTVRYAEFSEPPG